MNAQSPPHDEAIILAQSLPKEEKMSDSEKYKKIFKELLKSDYLVTMNQYADQKLVFIKKIPTDWPLYEAYLYRAEDNSVLAFITDGFSSHYNYCKLMVEDVAVV